MDHTFWDRWLPRILVLLAIVLGGLHAWTAAQNQSMNPDGIAYLDMGEAYLEGDWSVAMNGYWSPLYAWLLALGIRTLDPAMPFLFPTVHLTNFTIYLLAMGCFSFFWRQVMRHKDRRVSEPGSIGLPRRVWLGLGYTLFVWSSLTLIKIWSVTPDMLVAAFVYLAAGFILRIRMESATWRTYVLLGGVLGLGYLSKAIMFPLSLVFLLVAVFSARNWRRATPLVLISLGCFVLVAGPFAIALSLVKGRPTFGDSGKLNYARYVNGLPDAHWQGEVPRSGTPIHPTRKIFDAPAIYEFATPLDVTYPPWYDPSYWYEGVKLQFNLRDQISVLLTHALSYLNLIFGQQTTLVAGVVILYVMSQWSPLAIHEIVRRWGVLVPALAAFSMYALVYVETRYLAPFMVLIWADLMANVRLPDSQTSSRLVSLLGAMMILFTWMHIVAFNLEQLSDSIGGPRPRRSAGMQARPPSWPGEVAEALHELGVDRGEAVAIIGYGFDSFWARLARVRIVAEMLGHEADPFWVGSPALQHNVIQAFASTGAKAIVAEHVPSYASLVGWHQVGGSDHYIYLLP